MKARKSAVGAPRLSPGSPLCLYGPRVGPLLSYFTKSARSSEGAGPSGGWEGQSQAGEGSVWLASPSPPTPVR